MRWNAPPALFVALALGLGSCGGDAPPEGDAGPVAGADAGTDGGVAPGCVEPNGECTTPGGGECCDDLVCRASSGGRAFCVAPDDTCFVGPETGCCLDDADCAGGERCHLAECRTDGDGVCKTALDDGTCFSDRDCPAGQTCTGATLCPCGASCTAPDTPGTCG